MTQPKETEFTIQANSKETIQDRLKQLFRGRNLRQVAKDWGLPYSTLNNYFSKGAKPGLDVVESICNKENASIEWLITGKETGGEKTSNSNAISSKKAADNTESLRAAWGMAFEFMDKAEAAELLRIIISGGARRIINMAIDDTQADDAFRALSPELKARAIELIAAHEEAKKGASAGYTEGNLKDPTHKQAS